MKFQLKNIAFALIASTTLISCDKEEVLTPITPISGNGTAVLKFDNVVSTSATTHDDLLLNNYSFTTSSGEVLTVSDINYIVSNVVLIKEDGTEFTYSKDSLFIVNEKLGLEKVNLAQVPTGKYTKVKFGVGVEKTYWEKGEAGQQKFWDKAKLDSNRLTWSWTSGYKFVLFEGSFKADATAESKNYKVHLGGYTPNNNYREITLTLPAALEVKSGQESSAHIYTDVKHIIDGHNALKFSEGAAIMGGDRSVKVADNLDHVFFVDHVHNH